MSKRGDRINAAIGKLASLFEYGTLQADTVPEDFLGTVTDEVKRLRQQRDELLAHLRQWLELHGTETSQLTHDARALIRRIEEES